jgi:UDP-N-acetylmuramate--alanine ligase
VVLISSAVDAANPERVAAVELGIPVVKRDEFLPALLAGRRLIAVAGTHGKTTTTAMTCRRCAGAASTAATSSAPTCRVYGSAAAGSAPEFVIEADEYDRMFLGLRPAIAVVTNVEWDHPDCYPTPASFRRAFMQFTDGVERDGLIIACIDDPGAVQVHAYAPTRGPRWITYGLTRAPTCARPTSSRCPGGGSEADLALVECAGRRAASWTWPACTTCATRWRRWRWRSPAVWTSTWR